MGHVAVYGRVAIRRTVCPCGSQSLVINDRTLCCDLLVEDTYNSFKFETTSKGRRKLPDKEYRDNTLKEQDNKCLYCQEEFGSWVMIRKKLVRLRVNWDHLIPFSYLQENPTRNFVAACQICNGIKSNKIFETIEEIRLYVFSKRSKNKKVWSREMRLLHDNIHKDKESTEILQPELSGESLERQESEVEKIRIMMENFKKECPI